MIQKETSETLRDLLKAVVSEGSGRNCKIEGFSIGGKTATSEKLPRGNGKYISSFLGFSKAEDPTVMGIVLIDEPEGTYYGGTIAGAGHAQCFSGGAAVSGNFQRLYS